MPDRVGQQLGNYRLLRLLGRGGQASVYLGEHVYLKRRAALKVLHTSLEDEAVEQFLAEAQTLARLDHPNIVRVSDFAVEGGTPFLVMDYAPRGTLRTLHPPGSCLSLEATITSAKQVAAALQYAHNHQVIHRDVKPENMLLGPRQEMLLSDFGISLFAPSPEQLSTQEMAGTLPYMAPEQIRGKPVFASDQYALGIVVYEWLCGVRPFAGSLWQIVSQHASDPPPPLRGHDPSLPQAVEDVVLKALAKDPQDRYVSVSLFAQALERACQEQPLDLRSEADVTAQLGHPSPAPPVTPTVVPRRVFVVAAQAEDAFVARLTADMQRRGVVCWQEGSDGTGQVHEQEHLLRQAIRAVEVVLVVVSPSTASSRTVKACLRVASLYQRRLVFVWAAGEEIADVLPPAWDNKMVQIDLVDAREERYEEALEDLLASLEVEAPLEESTLPEPVVEPRNPYKGLRAFSQADAADFFGRDRLIEELVERMKALVAVELPGMPTARLLSVIGPSGSGKSSVVMAGLLPRLRQGVLPGSEQWVYLEPMVPGTHPLEALALTLAPHLPGRSLKNLREDLEDGSARGLHLLAKQLSTTGEQKVVLLVDQLEELFTLTTSEEERQQFIDLLTTAVTEPQGGVIVLLTLRADFYDRPMAYPTLHQLLETHQKSVLPMEVADLRAVIRRPAALPDVQLSFEGNVVGDLLFEVQGQVGALPLLQFTLEQLFQRRDEHTLTLAAYREIGGVKGALAKHAEATYAALPSQEHRRLARALFLRLIDPGLTEQDTTRRRAALSELRLPDAQQTTIMREAADAFIAARLLTTNEVAGTTTLEVSHEALIREWTRLEGWLRDGREDTRLQQTLSEDASEWQRRKQSADRLYRGSQLKEAKAWARRNTPSGNEVAFLRASAASRVRSVVSVIAVLLLVVASISTAGWFLTHQAPKPPDTTRVTNLQDHGPGSLRQAIDVSPPGSTITFDPGLRGAIMLTSNDLIVSKNLDIQGPKTGLLFMSGSHGILISPNISVTLSDIAFKGSKVGANGIISNAGTLRLMNVTFSDNSMISNVDRSGLISNSANGTLILTNSRISGNTGHWVSPGNSATLSSSGTSDNAAYYGMLAIHKVKSTNDTRLSGGGILEIFSNDGGTLTLINSAVLNNPLVSNDSIGNSNGRITLTNSTVSGNNGCGIGSSGTVTLTNSIITHNHGCSIYNAAGTLTLSGSTVSDNSAYYFSDVTAGSIMNFKGQAIIDATTISSNNDGCGLVNFGVTASLTVTNSTIADNKGCGIDNLSGTITLTNSSISGNTTFSRGGGIFSLGGQLTITFCTISRNTAVLGGGILATDSTDSSGNRLPGKVTVSNSIVAGNHANTGPDISGTLIAGGYNLIQDFSGATFVDPLNKHHTDIAGDTFPNLGIDTMLQKNGGPTQTIALLPGSPAIDAIPLDECIASGGSTDQRGVKRPDGNEQFCDIGAYEYMDGRAGSALSGGDPLYEGHEKSTLVSHLMLVQSTTAFSTSPEKLGRRREGDS